MEYIIELVSRLAGTNLATKLGSFFIVASFLLLISTSNILPQPKRDRDLLQEESAIEEIENSRGAKYKMYFRVNDAIFRIGWGALFLGLTIFVGGLIFG
jgi:hypothetical protein